VETGKSKKTGRERKIRKEDNSIFRRKCLWSIALSPFITIYEGTEINMCD